MLPLIFFFFVLYRVFANLTNTLALCSVCRYIIVCATDNVLLLQFSGLRSYGVRSLLPAECKFKVAAFLDIYENVTVTYRNNCVFSLESCGVLRASWKRGSHVGAVFPT